MPTMIVTSTETLRAILPDHIIIQQLSKKHDKYLKTPDGDGISDYLPNTVRRVTQDNDNNHRWMPPNELLRLGTALNLGEITTIYLLVLCDFEKWLLKNMRRN